MPRARFNASAFPRGGPSGQIVLDFSWPEIVWAAVTVGKWRDDLFPHGRFSYFEALSRASLHWAYLHENSAGRIERSNAYNDLDATEKSGVSYAIGMSTAKLFAARQLQTPWLMHLDRYRVQFGVALRPGRSRPDLVGPRDVNKMLDWIVVEAKGRTHDLDAAAITSMRKQKQRVVTIGGQAPAMYVGSAAHFSTGDLEVEVIDPPARGRRPTELFVDQHSDPKRRFAAAYYGPLIELLEEQPSQHRDDTIMRDVPLADMAVGLPRQRFGSIRDFIRGDADDALLGANESAGAAGEAGLMRFVGTDDVIVELGSSWSDTLMRLQPRERVT